MKEKTMICPSCHQELTTLFCEFCNTSDTTKFQQLSKRFHKNSAWAKQQTNIPPEIHEQFAAEIADPLNQEQADLINQGLSPDALIALFEQGE
jgi:hypothetical protein